MKTHVPNSSAQLGRGPGPLGIQPPALPMGSQLLQPVGSRALGMQSSPRGGEAGWDLAGNTEVSFFSRIMPCTMNHSINCGGFTLDKKYISSG